MVSTTGITVQAVANGVTVAFPYGNKFISDSDLVVTTTDTAGLDNPEVLGVDYTVSGAGDDTGGTVTFTTAPIDLHIVTITRVTPLTQLVDYIKNDDFPSETHEGALDKLTLIVQEAVQKLLSSSNSVKALSYPDTELVGINNIVPILSARKSTAWIWDANGEPAAGATTTGTILNDITLGLPTPSSTDGTSQFSVVGYAARQPSSTTENNIPQWDSVTGELKDGLDFLDEDNMVSDSATALSSQQAIKAYADLLSSNRLTGLTVSNGTDGDHDLDFTAFSSMDSTNAAFGNSVSDIGKQFDITWADGGTPGTPVGGMASGESLPALGSLHVFALIKPDGSMNVGGDTSVTAANLIVDAVVIAAGYTLFKRIFTIWCDTSNNIIAFTNDGDYVELDDTTLGANVVAPVDNALTSVILAGAPDGVATIAILVGSISTNAGALAPANYVNWYTPGASNPLADSQHCWAVVRQADATSMESGFYGTVLTDLARKVAYIFDHNASSGLQYSLRGYIDKRD